MRKVFASKIVKLLFRYVLNFYMINDFTFILDIRNIIFIYIFAQMYRLHTMVRDILSKYMIILSGFYSSAKWCLLGCNIYYVQPISYTIRYNVFGLHCSSHQEIYSCNLVTARWDFAQENFRLENAFRVNG